MNFFNWCNFILMILDDELEEMCYFAVSINILRELDDFGVSPTYRLWATTGPIIFTHRVSWY